MYDQGFRIAALKLYEHFCNMKLTAKALNIGIGTIWRWKNKGIANKERKKVSFPEALLSFVKLKLLHQNHLTQNDLKQLIKDAFNKDLSRQCIATILKILNMTRKRLRKRGYRKNNYSDRMQSFKEKINTTSLENIISIDEIGFDQRMLPLYGYSLKGTKALGNTHPSNRTRLNAIVAINNKGNIYFEIIQGSINASHFKDFILNIPCTEDDVLIMDNVSFHKTNDILETFKNKKLTPLFIPPYTPECNPIENIFSVVKNKYRKLATLKDYDQMDIVAESFYSVKASMFSKCFKKMQKFINITNFYNKENNNPLFSLLLLNHPIISFANVSLSFSFKYVTKI